MDWEAEGLLAGLEDEDGRKARRELLDHLHEDGCSVDELREAVHMRQLLRNDYISLAERTSGKASETSETTVAFAAADRFDWSAAGERG
jgi:hypothetical protein